MFKLHVRRNGATRYTVEMSAPTVGALVDAATKPGAYARCLWSVQTADPAHGAVSGIPIVVANGYALPPATS